MIYIKSLFRWSLSDSVCLDSKMTKTAQMYLIVVCTSILNQNEYIWWVFQTGVWRCVVFQAVVWRWGRCVVFQAGVWRFEFGGMWCFGVIFGGECLEVYCVSVCCLEVCCISGLHLEVCVWSCMLFWTGVWRCVLFQAGIWSCEFGGVMFQAGVLRVCGVSEWCLEVGNIGWHVFWRANTHTLKHTHTEKHTSQRQELHRVAHVDKKLRKRHTHRNREQERAVPEYKRNNWSQPL